MIIYPTIKRYKHFGKRLITILLNKNNDNKNLKKKRKITCLWLLASLGPRGSVIFSPFWGQVTKSLFFKLHDR